MKKILYVCCNFVWGGVEQYILNVVDYIDRNKFQIDILLPQRDRYEREDALEARGIRVLKYQTHPLKAKIGSIYRVIKENEYDIIHFHTGHESALLCLIVKVAGCKNVVIHAHTTKSGDANISKIHLLKKKCVFKLSEIIYYNIATACVACSADAVKFMFGDGNTNVKILMNGIDLERFSNKNRGSDYSFCINARFDPQKNPLFVVDVIAELVKLEPKVSLEWIGSGYMQNEVEAYIRRLNLEKHVTLLGTLNHVENVLARNRFFLFPSLYEGLGIVLIEAQAAGMKCFVSDQVPQSAQCGGCVTIPIYKTARQWAEIIQREIKENPKAQIEDDKIKQFDIKHTVRELENFYCELME